MMQQNNNKLDDTQLKEILKDSKLTASENLKYRIMHQIETEKALLPHKQKKSFSVLKSMLSVFGTMYAVIAVAAIMIYVQSGKAALESISTYLLIILIAATFGLFWMITIFDEKRRSSK